MNYSLTLESAFLIAGLLLLLLGGAALAWPAATEAWLLAFPRSRSWGIALLIVAAAWFWLLVDTMDLGEFGKWKTLILWITPIAAILTGRFVDELLAARSLGMVVLLAAEPLLEAAFLRHETSRLYLVLLAYVAVVAAMFWIGMPYVLRDQLRWLTGSHLRLRGAAALLALYGAILLISDLTLHRSA